MSIRKHRYIQLSLAIPRGTVHCLRPHTDTHTERMEAGAMANGVVTTDRRIARRAWPRVAIVNASVH